MKAGLFFCAKREAGVIASLSIQIRRAGVQKKFGGRAGRQRHCHLATRASDPSRGRLRSVGKASLSSRYLRTERRMIVESPAAGLLPTGVGG
jgi:hypothetical protein